MLDTTYTQYSMDRTNSLYRETGMMRELPEQWPRMIGRKGKEDGNSRGIKDHINKDKRSGGGEYRSKDRGSKWEESGTRANELSLLVRSL